MRGITFGTGSAIAKAPTVVGDCAARTIEEAHEQWCEPAVRAGDELSIGCVRALHADLLRDIRGAAGTAHCQRDGIETWLVVGFDRIDLAAEAVIAEIPLVAGDLAGRLIAETHRQRYRADHAILCECCNRARNVGCGRGNRGRYAVLDANIVDDGGQGCAVAEVDSQTHLICAVIDGGRVPDTEQTVHDLRLDGSRRWEPEIAGIWVRAEFDLVLQEVRGHRRADDLHVAGDDIARHWRQDHDADRRLCWAGQNGWPDARRHNADGGRHDLAARQRDPRQRGRNAAGSDRRARRRKGEPRRWGCIQSLGRRVASGQIAGGECHGQHEHCQQCDDTVSSGEVLHDEPLFIKGLQLIMPYYEFTGQRH